MRPQIDIAAFLTAAPGNWLLTLTHDDDKPVAHRSAVQCWALEAGELHPYPVTVEYGLVVESVAILRPDGAVETHAATFHENEQEWLEEAHADYLAGRTRQACSAAREYIADERAQSRRQPLPASAPSPAGQAIDAALDCVRKATAERLAAPQSAHVGKASP